MIDFPKSDRILGALKAWPLALLPAARSIRDHEAFARQYRDRCHVPEGDKLALEMISFSIVVPIEKRHILLHSLESMLSDYRDHSIPRFSATFRRPDFEGNGLARGSWHRVGSSFMNPKMRTGLRYVDVCLFRDTESFLVCTFHVLPDDQLRYGFWKIAHNNFVEKIVPHPTFRRFFRPWGYSIYKESHVFLNQFNSFLSETRAQFVDLIKRNGIGYFIGNPAEIPSVFIFSLSRAGSNLRRILRPKDRRNDFWDCQDIPVPDDDNRMFETFSDLDSTIYLPSGSFRNQDQPNGTRLLYVDVDRIVVPEIYRDLENYLLEQVFEWGAVLNGNLCYQSFLNYLYRQIRELRDDYYAARTSRRSRLATMLRLSTEIEELLYWYSRYSQEYTTPDARRARHFGFPELRTPPLREEGTIDYLEFLGRVTTQTKSSLERLTTFYHGSITRFRELSMLRSSTRLQRLVMGLTVATIILGISQLLGLDLVLKAIRELAKVVSGWISHL